MQPIQYGPISWERMIRAVEKVRERLDHAVDHDGPFRVLDLEPLVRMKLTSYRLRDRVHLLDMIGVGLIDETWPTRFPAALAERLQSLLENPDG